MSFLSAAAMAFSAVVSQSGSPPLLQRTPLDPLLERLRKLSAMWYIALSMCYRNVMYELNEGESKFLKTFPLTFFTFGQSGCLVLIVRVRQSCSLPFRGTLLNLSERFACGSDFSFQTGKIRTHLLTDK